LSPLAILMPENKQSGAQKKPSRLRQGLERLAGSVLDHPRRWLWAWLIVLLLALPGFLQVKNFLVGGNGGVTQSQALHTKDLIEQRFNFPFSNSYLIVVDHPKITLEDLRFERAMQRLEAVIQTFEDTEGIESWYHSRDPLMRNAKGNRSFLLVGQTAVSSQKLELRTGEIRTALQPLVSELKDKQGFEIFVTGMNAVIYDINKITTASTEAAEKQVFGLTLVVLLLAFGSLTGAFLPLLMAIVSMVISLALVAGIAQFTVVSTYAQSISSMIGLAVGIDYALLLVWRLRQEREQGLALKQALHQTILTAGKSVIFAGGTFLIGLAGLFFSGITALFSIGLGGILVVIVSVAASLTLLPALLLVLGPWLDFPKSLATRLQGLRPSRLWKPLAYHVMRHPWVYGAASLAIVLALSSPALKLQIRQFDMPNLPSHLESKQGFDRLTQMEVSGMMIPIYIVLETTQSSFLNTTDLHALQRVHAQLQANPLIERVVSLATPLQEHPNLAGQLPLMRLLAPNLFNLLLSRDQQLTLMQIVPKRLSDFDEMVDLCANLRKALGPELKKQGITLHIGGPPALTLDYNEATFSHSPQILIGVVVMTWIVLLFSLRSWLIALKAIVLNLCSVAVSYGIITLIFQEGLIPGIHTQAIMAYVPLLLFCLIFGLSIDYEVFLMTRIREAYESGESNEEATATGIRATGDVITYAALVMGLVFGAFTQVEISIIKQLGFGLATAIIVDATLIRMVLVPAFMKIGGRWNWR
jgi:putative drug exporter of the RND superfamily